jgi:uncharacterized SAM-binding protein YcdF (DUF218 family)
MAWRMWQRSRWFVGVLLSALAWHSSCALQGAVVILVMLVVGTVQVSMAYPCIFTFASSLSTRERMKEAVDQGVIDRMS